MILAPRQTAHVASVGLAFPSNVVDQDDTLAVLSRLFPGEATDKIRCMVSRSGVERRHIVPTMDEVLAPSDFSQRNLAYRDAAVDLASRACQQALDRSGLEAADIDVLIDVSCTGISIPALDVSIAPRLGLRPDVRRVPITESGCAGGALGLNVAAGLAQAGMCVMVVAVELCSLSMVSEDRTRTNLVASVIFGDGAAACVVAPGGGGPRIEATSSHLIPETEHVMGFDIGSHGMRIILQRELPGIVAGALPGIVHGFLEGQGRSAPDLDMHLIHPGGKRILDAYEDRFDLPVGELRLSRGVLADCGNLSSASILAVLERALASPPEGDGDREALLLAIGPGLSVEMALLCWDGVGNTAAR
jgi:alkylresorcinol/alkylpyrone synthase